MAYKIKTIELFAGVGGFRIGLQNASDRYDIVWSNQWEPSTKSQDASDTYVARFGQDNHINKDIATINAQDIPSFDLLVGGFPCQDYSVAKTLSQSAGLEGKKGVLWWEITRILETHPNAKYVILENVDRLLKSPAKQRGRDFAIILASLSDLGFAVEWRVVNAAEYGFPQRRRRTFIVAYRKETQLYNQSLVADRKEWLIGSGVLAAAFPVKTPEEKKFSSGKLVGELDVISSDFNIGKKDSPFNNSGMMINREFHTVATEPNYDGPFVLLGDILLPDEEVAENFFIDEKTLEKWIYLKGGKKEKRVNKTSGIEYDYNEGPMTFPDALDRPSRTIITGEGGASASRFKHVVKSPTSGRLRRLTPIELERLNMFPDNHTIGCTDIKRAFFMGNALVTGVIKNIGIELEHRIEV